MDIGKFQWKFVRYHHSYYLQISVDFFPSEIKYRRKNLNKFLKLNISDFGSFNN